MLLIYLFQSHSEAFKDSMEGESEDGEEVPDRTAVVLAGQQVRVGQPPLFLGRGTVGEDKQCCSNKTLQFFGTGLIHQIFQI